MPGCGLTPVRTRGRGPHRDELSRALAHRAASNPVPGRRWSQASASVILMTRDPPSPFVPKEQGRICDSVYRLAVPPLYDTRLLLGRTSRFPLAPEPESLIKSDMKKVPDWPPPSSCPAFVTPARLHHCHPIARSGSLGGEHELIVFQ